MITTPAIGRHARPPSPTTWAIYIVACLHAWLLGATGGRHAKPVRVRPAYGADPQWADTLAEMRVELDAAHRMLGDTPAWPTEDRDYDATEAALTAAARRAGLRGRDASDLLGGAL